MRIELLGSGGYHPNERRHTLCVLLPEQGLMLDAGSGAFRAHGRVTTPHLDVVLTHAHLDHIVGLPSLLDLRHRGEPVTIRLHATPEVGQAVRESLFAKRLFPLMTVHEFHELPASAAEVGDTVLTTFPLDHPGGSLGVRVEWGGRSIALVTDTRPLTPETIDEIHGVDLLLHEAYFDDDQVDMARLTGHCTARHAANAAKQAGARRLVMIHRDPRATDDAKPLAEAREVYPTAEYGEDLQAYEV
ncbi:MAG: MBL fold metallo-hydrolase [Planctomycetota bacterium]